MATLIAITGGIGSGKSTVLEILKREGYPVYSADEVYRDLLADNSFSKEVAKITETELIGGQIDRRKISEKVFSDKELLTRLNEYTHPLIMAEMIKRSSSHKGVVFNEVPLLFEEGFEALYDKVLIIMRDSVERIKYASLRDGVEENSVISKINNQFDYKNVDKEAYTLLYNDGDITSLEIKVKNFVDKIKNE